jgi:hypothetical protein
LTREEVEPIVERVLVQVSEEVRDRYFLRAPRVSVPKQPANGRGATTTEIHRHVSMPASV